MFRFLSSSHKWFYFITAIKFGCMPDYVYDIAHCKHYEGKKVERIRHYLVEKKIVRREKMRRSTD
ncbi:MAG: hypothetical protein IIV57_07545 [Bacteroidaceae bacterium]|nr:hypothetical protein [Bacteroidaceae bacterium]